jgi:hypothetical protein
VSDASIDWLTVGGPVEPWLGLGLVSTAADRDGRRLIPLFGPGIEVDTTAAPGLRRLVMSGVDPGLTSVDGIAIEVRDPTPPMFAAHPLGARAVDHVVVSTDDLVRTCGAIADATGAPLKRVREAGTMRQGFHRVGRLVVEVVERAGQEPGPASLWGLALDVDDLAGVASRLGTDLVGEVRAAVQPGRSIATVHDDAGLGVPVVLMTPSR